MHSGRSAFCQIVSHGPQELYNPCTGINWFAKRIFTGVSGRQQAYVATRVV